MTKNQNQSAHATGDATRLSSGVTIDPGIEAVHLPVNQRRKGHSNTNNSKPTGTIQVVSQAQSFASCDCTRSGK
jgi:hypothetical protein